MQAILSDRMIDCDELAANFGSRVMGVLLFTLHVLEKTLFLMSSAQGLQISLKQLTLAGFPESLLG